MDCLTVVKRFGHPGWSKDQITVSFLVEILDIALSLSRLGRSTAPSQLLQFPLVHITQGK